MIWTAESVFVRSARISNDASAPWIAIDQSTPTTKRDAIIEALGPSLADYALATELPVHPTDLSKSVLALSSSIEETDSGTVDSRVVRATVDGTIFADSESALPDDNAALVLEFSLAEDGRFSAIGVRDATADTGGESDSFGFTLTFDWAITQSSVESSRVSEAQAVRQVTTLVGL